MTFAMFLFVAMSTFAQWRSAQDALGIINSFRLHKSAGTHYLPSHVVPELNYTKISQGKPLFYVFNLGTNSGFVMVSGHEGTMTDVLGYAESGHFDQKHMPDALRELLGEYTRQIEFLAETPLLLGMAKSLVPAKADKARIEPLLTSKWGQDTPFCNLCPEGTPTGCVSTALGQICYYYKYPNQGMGEHSYIWNGQTLSANFGETTYDWDKMLPEYGMMEYADDKALAVATLLSHLGISVEAKYAPGGTSGSMSNGLASLYEHFGYDDDMFFAQRENYTDDEWDELIYSELSKMRPVIYDGQGGVGGHAFIVDGYDNLRYHVNWGWEGYEDGYYFLSSLIPPSLQYAGGFAYYQNAYLSIIPSDANPANPHLESYGLWQTSNRVVEQGDYAAIGGGVMNCGLMSQDVLISVVAKDVEDGSIVELENVFPSFISQLPMSYYFEPTIQFSTSNLKQGHSYVILPVSMSADETSYTMLPIANDPASLTFRISSDEEEDALQSLERTSDKTYFTLDGKCLNQPTKGVRIIRMSDRSVRKVMNVR